MTIRIRLPKTKNGTGQLSLYRPVYKPASRAQSGERIPGHQKEVYLGSLPRFTPDGMAAGAITFHDPTAGKLADDEHIALNAFLKRDYENRRAIWPKELYDEIEAAVRSELFAGITEQSNLDVLANTLRGAGPEIEHEAKLYRDQGQVLAEGWGNEARKTDATGLSELTRLKARVNEVRQAWAGFEAAVQAAGMIVKRPRPSKKGGAQ